MNSAPSTDRRFIAVASLLAALLAAGATAPRILPGPEQMPEVTPDMRTPEFWISRVSEPDRVLITPRGARRLAERWRRAGILPDLEAVPWVLSGSLLRAWVTEEFGYLSQAGKYTEHGRPAGPEWHAQIRENSNLRDIRGSNPVIPGWMVNPAVLRLAPSPRLLTVKPGDEEFDLLAGSGLRLAEPVKVLHRSADRQWVFVATGVGRGWVPDEAVARAERSAWEAYLRRADRVVVAAETELSDGQGLTVRARMGCWLAPAEQDPHALWVPVRQPDGASTLRAVWPRDPRDVRTGPLPCTPRVLLTQGFRLLDRTYGWGGQGGYGDCSEILRRIGLSAGLDWPRSSTALARAWPGRDLAPGRGADKRRHLDGAPGGASLLFLPGHVMLVLGAVDGRVYVLHNLYGIHGRDRDGDWIARVARVVVSDLSLGRGSRQGSLLERSDRIAWIEEPGIP